jgi:subtilase family serine protease
MSRRPAIFLFARLFLATGALATVPAVGGGTPATSTTSATSVLQASSAVATPISQVGATPAATSIDFDVALALSDAAGAVALQRAVSDPASSSYRHYLSPAQWERRFSPTESSVGAARSASSTR